MTCLCPWKNIESLLEWDIARDRHVNPMRGEK